MRLILAAAAALTALALPAQAQRLDTRRIDVKTDEHHTECRFTGFPELKLVYTKSGKAASWIKPAEGAATTGVKMSLVVGPAENWRRPGIIAMLITGPQDPALATAAKASLRVDDEAPAPLSFSGRDDSFMLMGGSTAYEAIYAMIDGGHHAEVDVLDAGGKVLRTYSWDVRRLSDAFETVSVVGWSCTSP